MAFVQVMKHRKHTIMLTTLFHVYDRRGYRRGNQTSGLLKSGYAIQFLISKLSPTEQFEIHKLLFHRTSKKNTHQQPLIIMTSIHNSRITILKNPNQRKHELLSYQTYIRLGSEITRQIQHGKPKLGFIIKTNKQARG